MQFEIFYNLLTEPQTVSNTYAQVAQVQSCANHVQHIECLSHAAWHVTCHVVRIDSSAIKFDRVEIAFIWAWLYWLKHSPMKEGRKPEYPDKIPGKELLQQSIKYGRTYCTALHCTALSPCHWDRRQYLMMITLETKLQNTLLSQIHHSTNTRREITLSTSHTLRPWWLFLCVFPQYCCVCN